MKIQFFVPGKPAPGGSKKFIPHAKTGKMICLDMGKNNAGWKKTVAKHAAVAYRGPLLEGALIVQMVFFVLRPQGHFGEGRNAGTLKPSAPRFPTVKPDVLKLARSTEDALTGVVWKDDSATVDLILSKRYGDKPGVEIEIREW